MSSRVAGVEAIKKKAYGYWGERIVAQLEYACKLNRIDNGEYDSVIGRALDILEAGCEKGGLPDRNCVMEAERQMTPLYARAKSFKMICAAHAHIDMNWLWGYVEEEYIKDIARIKDSGIAFVLEAYSMASICVEF